MATRRADVVVTLLEGWREADNGGGPVTYAPGPHGGALQISSPASSLAWRGADLEGVVDYFLAGTGLGTRKSAEEIPSRWSRAVRVEVESARYEDVAVWLFVHDTHDGVLVTWIGDRDPRIGREARAIVEGMEPGPFSVAVDMVVSVLRGNVERDGGVDAHAVLVAEGMITTATFAGMAPAEETEALRFEREKVKASVVARVGMVTATRKDSGEEHSAAFALVASADRVKAFFLPAHERGRVVLETDPAELPWKDLFRAPDPDVVAALRSSSRLS